jgi:hypothetical protein
MIVGDLNLDARARHQALLDEVSRERLANACRTQLPFTRRAARPLGRALFKLGARLLRYGKVEQPAIMPLYRPSAHSIELN